MSHPDLSLFRESGVPVWKVETGTMLTWTTKTYHILFNIGSLQKRKKFSI